ncbi:MAG: SDR family NAD(P)-dependent oxidoreductase [Acidobacteria bacterium]|nr:SDR family NAD(P)-dependent oxidoreductase [Acidobacteriota bacterium]
MTKKVIITGAASDIGRALAAEFAHGGFDLFLTGRGASELERTAARCAEKFRVRADYLPVELSDPASTGRLLAAVSGREFDILVNSPETGETEWPAAGANENLPLLGRRFASMIRLTKSVLAKMIRRRSGRILNVAPACSVAGFPELTADEFYKTSVLSFSAALENELKNFGITVTVGCFETEAAGPKSGRRKEKLIARALYRQTMRGNNIAVTL